MSSLSVTFNKRSFLIRIYWVTLAVVFLYILLYLVFNVPVYKTFILTGLAALLAVGLVLTSKVISIKFSSHYYSACCYLALCLYCSSTGGLKAPGAIWFMICPLICFLTVSGRGSGFWLGLVLVTLASFYFFRDVLVTGAYKGGDYWYLTTYGLFFPTVYAFLKIFRAGISRKNNDLAALNKLLEEKQRKLEDSAEELMLQRDQLKDAEQMAVDRNNKLGNYLNLLLEVSKMEELHTGSLDYSIQTIQRILLKSMDLDEVAIWHFDDENKSFQSIGLSGEKNNGVYSPVNLSKENLQGSIEMLESGVIMETPRDTPGLQKLNQHFRRQNSTAAMIACPYFIEGKFAGFFTCHAGNRQWTAEDVIFVRAISDALPLAFKSHERKNQQLLLEKRQQLITELNESLEQKVVERTVKLKMMNEQLLNFAFINSHNIRGPICRLLGLRNLLMLTADPRELMTLREYLSTSIEELDDITRKASKLLNDTISQEEV